MKARASAAEQFVGREGAAPSSDPAHAGPPRPARGEGRGAAKSPLPSRERVAPEASGEGAPPGESARAETLRQRARDMRKEPTDAERALWRLLRDRRFAGYKFRRQVPIGDYIADFVCFSERLIVEADGSQHAESARDARRDAWFAAQGFRVRRFWNADILRNREMVAETLWSDLAAPSSDPR